MVKFVSVLIYTYIHKAHTYFVPTKRHELTQAQGDIKAQKGQVPALTDLML